MSAAVLDAGERARRRAAVAHTPGVRALDGVDAHPEPDGTLVLRLRFVPPARAGAAAAPPDVRPAQVRVTGPAGPVPVVSVTPDEGALLVVAVMAPGADPAGEYTVELDAVPSMDPLLSTATTRVPPAHDGAAPGHGTVPQAMPDTGRGPVDPQGPPPPSIDYLARDYATFRTQMLDRMAITLPRWTERHAADIGVMLVEMLAYAADYLSYYQDAAATEAYLGTARLRTSLARHARLLDYRVNQGCSALAWVHVRVAAPARIPRRSRLHTRTRQPAPVLLPGTPAHAMAMAEHPVSFETVDELRATPGMNTLPIYTWGAASYTLPLGATRCTFLDHREVGGFALDALEPGTVLVLQEQVGPAGRAADAAHRQAVRVAWVERGADPTSGARVVNVGWHDADALAVPLVVAGSAAGAPYTGGAVALGNVVLATQGVTSGPWTLPPVPPAGPYRPYVPHPYVARRQPWDHAAVARAPASALAADDPGRAVGQVWLTDQRGRHWASRADLLRGTPFSRDFVVEADEDGASRLRFGDGTMGMRPPAGTRFTLECRVGIGTQGNVGRDVLAHLEPPAGDPGAARIAEVVQRVGNPLPGWGGADAEAASTVRARAPRAYQTQDRGVTPTDWKALAEALPQVRRAAAVAGWRGTRPQDEVWVQRKEGLTEDEAFLAGVAAALEPRRLAGRQLRVLPPVYVGVSAALRVGLESRAVRAAAAHALRAALGAGPGGVFRPAALTFGESVWLSVVVAAASAVPGVAWVEPARFARWDPYGLDGAVRDELPMAPREVARMAGNDAEPWNGTLALELLGGIG